MKMRATDLSVRYGEKTAIDRVMLEVHENEVLALIGPSGCGKSTFLRALNRMNETIDSVTTTGRVELDGSDIYAPDVDPVLVETEGRPGLGAPEPYELPDERGMTWVSR